jgi:RND family efflux transporter MFP subunit
MAAQKNKGNVLVKVVLVLVVLAAIGFVAQQQMRLTARVKAAERQDTADAVMGTVTVDALGSTRELKSDAAGKVKWCEPLLERSAKFRKGDKLLELDTTELLRQIADFKRQFAYNSEVKRFELSAGKPELLGNLEKASDEEIVKKYEDLSQDRALAVRKKAATEKMFELNAASQEDLRAATRALEDIDNRLKRIVLDDRKNLADYESKLDELNKQLERMTLLAPADGQLHEVFTWEGAQVGQGQPVATWFSNERIVAAKISEEDFAKVKIGQKANLRLLTYGQREFDAVVSGFHPKADDAQRFTVYLNVKVDHPEQVLLPNSTGEVVITVEERKNALMIPRRAVFDGNKVFVVKNGHVEKREVAIGFIVLNLAEVRSGLKDGELVIVDNLDQFRDGRRVQTEVLK